MGRSLASNCYCYLIDLTRNVIDRLECVQQLYEEENPIDEENR